MVKIFIAMSAAFLFCSCSSNGSDPADARAEDIADDVSEEKVAALRSQIDDLNQRPDEVEGIAKEARDQAAEAEDLAESAKRTADDACEPYGYDPGCGNDR